MARSLSRLPAGVDSFCRLLLGWYRKQQRDLPWRNSSDPYRIWLSEIMLQQTRVSTVIPYFHRFVDTYPTLEDLASAELDQVMDLWSGLGYYGRARNLHEAAQIIRDKHNGSFPKEYNEAIALPGIGPYSASAILSIAYDKPYAVLDGNVRRVFSRYLAIREELKGSALKDLKSLLSELAVSVQLRDSIADFNQALMELGALVCTPGEPACPECPLVGSCVAFANNLQNRLPESPKKRSPQELSFTSVVIERDGRLLMLRNCDEPYLKEMWEFPKVEGLYTDENLSAQLREVHGLEVSFLKALDPVIHRITFRRITFYPVLASLLAKPGPRFHWVRFGEKPYPISSYIRKIIQLLQE